jgi:hypothetical protein
MIYLCSCGFATDDEEWLGGHLDDYPGHDERDAPQDTDIRRLQASRIRSAVTSGGDRDPGHSPPGWLRHQGVSHTPIRQLRQAGDRIYQDL